MKFKSQFYGLNKKVKKALKIGYILSELVNLTKKQFKPIKHRHVIV